MAAFVPLVVFANIGRAVGRRNDIAKSKDQFGEVRLRAWLRTLYLAPLSAGSGPSLSDQGMLLNHSGITPGSLRRGSLIGLDLLLAVQGAKSSEGSGWKRKGKPLNYCIMFSAENWEPALSVFGPNSRRFWLPEQSRASREHTLIAPARIIAPRQGTTVAHFTSNEYCLSLRCVTAQRLNATSVESSNLLLCTAILVQTRIIIKKKKKMKWNEMK